jgi:hypothetical protein
MFTVVGIYFLIVVKSFHRDLKERQVNNSQPV